MCVQTKGYHWERPATEADCKIMSEHFSGVDFSGLLAAMSQDGAKPLTTDLALVGAMMHTAPDDLGMRYVPFSAIETNNSQNVIKLPVMEQVLDWLENSALGTDMWQNASDWCEAQNGTRVHFAMNCGCGLVAVADEQNGTWTAWKKRFNDSRAHLFGRTNVVTAKTNDVTGLDMTEQQLAIWMRLRRCLEALPAESTAELKAA